MQRRIINSIHELFNENSPQRFEIIQSKKRIPKTLKEALKNERGLGKYIKGDPESKGKSEDQIETEVEHFLNTITDCAWWNIKIKGEIQSIGKGLAIIKKSMNVGFADILACIKGFFIMIEIKACKRYQSPDQINQQEKVQKHGKGFYFLVTSVRELKIYLVECGFINR